MTETRVPEPVASFIEAVNQHDSEGFLSAFTTEGVVDDWGRIFTGEDQIKAWSDKEFIGARGTLTPEEVFSDADELVVIGDWRSNHANGRSRFAFLTQDEKIVRMTIREG